MTILLWGEPLAKSWVGSGATTNEQATSLALVIPITTVEETRDTPWNVLVCTEAVRGSIPREAYAQGIVAVVSSTKSETQDSTALEIPQAFWDADCVACVRILSRMSLNHQERTQLSQALQSFGETQAELADSTALLVHKLEQSIQIAAEIQRSLLPVHLPKIPGVELAGRFFPSHGVGGDYYDVFEFGDKKRFGFLLADSQTHGMAAALLSALLKVRSEQIRDDFLSASDFLAALSQSIVNEIPAKTADLHLFYGIFDRASLDFQFATAGDLKPLLLRSKAFVDIETNHTAALNHSRIDELPVNEWKLEPGDYLLLTTRGIHNLGLGKPLDAWVLDQITDKNEWPDLLDMQNEVAALAGDPEKLKQDITLIQLSIQPRALYLKR
jgi:serine phosphatase RsbU (regulator of sigma subunit)